MANLPEADQAPCGAEGDPAGRKGLLRAGSWKSSGLYSCYLLVLSGLVALLVLLVLLILLVSLGVLLLSVLLV